MATTSAYDANGVLVTANNTVVATWRDVNEATSGLGAALRWVAYSNAAYTPKFDTTITPVGVRFNSYNSGMVLNATTAGANCPTLLNHTWFIVITLPNLMDSNIFLQQGGYTKGGWEVLLQDSKVYVYWYGSGTGNNDPTYFDIGFTSAAIKGQRRALAWRVNTSNRTASFWIGGIGRYDSTTMNNPTSFPVPTTTNLSLGSRIKDATGAIAGEYGLNVGYIHELRAYTGVLGDSDVATILSALQTQYNC